MARGFWIGYTGTYDSWVDLSDVIESVAQEWSIRTPGLDVLEAGESLRIGEYKLPSLVLHARGWLEGPNLSDMRDRIAQILSRGHRISQDDSNVREIQLVRLSDDTGFRRARCEIVGASLPNWEHGAAPTEFEMRLVCGIPFGLPVTVDLNVPTQQGQWTYTSIPDGDGSELWSEIVWKMEVSANGDYDIEFQAYGEQGRGSRSIRVTPAMVTSKILHINGGTEDSRPFIGFWTGSAWEVRWDFYKSGWFPTMCAGSSRQVGIKVHSGTLANISSLQLQYNRRYYQL